MFDGDFVEWISSLGKTAGRSTRREGGRKSKVVDIIRMTFGLLPCSPRFARSGCFETLTCRIGQIGPLSVSEILCRLCNADKG